MKKTNKWLIILLSALICLCVAFATACGKTDEPNDDGGKKPGGDSTNTVISSDWETMPENKNENLKYFGYFHGDGFRSQGSYISEIASLKNSNVIMINSAWSHAAAQESLAAVKAAGMKAIFSVHGMFVGGQITQANTATLVANHEEVWNETATAIAEYIEDGTILGFYFDEPAWNGVPEDAFRTVTKMLRDKYPSIKVITTMTGYDIGIAKYEGYPELNASYNEYCTDVMYDSYGKWNDETRREYLEKLKSKALQNQWIWGCPKGFSDNPEQTGDMVEHIKGMYTEAIQEPRYVGIVSFSFADGIEGDWGYGLHTFFNNSGDYYDKALKNLYVDIGREVIGLPAWDHSKDVDLALLEPTEVYELGDTVELPAAGALDGNDRELEVTYTVTSPSGKAMPAESFQATESGHYTVTVSAGEGENKQTKSTKVSVREPGEISVFDTPAYLSDADGTDADTWCWPRQIDTTFSHGETGGGSLKITPHAKDGTWPRIIFARNGYQLWNISEYDYISMWVYNAGDEAIEGFALFVSDEDINSANKVGSTVSLPSKVWTEVTLSVAKVRESKPNLDLTKVTIVYGNDASDYKNRSVFYVDDVMLKNNEELPDPNSISFEKTADLNRIGDNADDVWTWPVSLSDEQAHGGNKSLKITVRQDGGVWPNVVFKGIDAATFDITNASEVSVWIYFDSDNELTSGGGTVFGFKVNNGENVNQAVKTFNIPARTWTELTITKDEILALAADIDLTQAKISIASLGSGYSDRSNFYLDDFLITVNQ